MTLSTFLSKHKVNKGDDFTHTCLRKCESYDIRGRELNTLYNLYVEALRNGEELNITEKHKTVSPILIDLDFRQEGKERLYDKKYVSTFMNTLVSTVKYYIDQQEMSVYVLEKPSPRLHKNTLYKDGLHIIMPDVLTVPQIQHMIRDDILSYHATNIVPDGATNDPSDVYDEAVIERNNWFMYGSKKPDETNPWRVTTAYRLVGDKVEEITDFSPERLVRVLSIRAPEMEESRYTAGGKAACKRRRGKGSVKDSVMSMSTYAPSSAHTQRELDLVKELIGILSIERADNYDTWMRVGWCLHNIDESLMDVWIDFSRKSSKFDDGTCERLWKNMKEGGGLNLGSLHRWAKEDAPVCYIDLMSKMRCTDDKCTLEDIMRSPNNYDYNYVKMVFERTHAKVMNPICYVCLKDTSEVIKDEAMFKKTYRNLYCTKRVSKDGEEGVKVVKFVEHWLDDRTIRTYESMDFCPPPRDALCDNTLNLWRGFAIDNIECASSNNITPFLDHLKVLVGYDDNGLEYFVKWLGHLVQYPGRLNGIALIFISEEGAGKNIFWDKFASMIGNQYYYETADPSKDLFGRFCNGRKGKLLIDIDEANSKDTFANSELIKNMITSVYLNFERKGVDPIELRNYARLVFTTNNLLCAKITDSTRRYVIYETSNKRIGDADYFTMFHTYMTDHKNQKAIMEYLRSVDLSNVNWIKDRPLTETYNALKAVCADPLLKFLTCIWEQNRDHNEVLYVASDLLRKYHDFLETKIGMKDSIKTWNATLFGLKMKSYCQDGTGIEKRVNVGPKKLIGYCFDTGILKSYLEKKGMLNEDTYMFIDTDNSDNDI
jgi:hypothetical protein